MGEYHLSLREAFYTFPMITALSLQTAAAERRGAKLDGPDFAEAAGDRAVANMRAHKTAN
jgi:hypothetical protein